MLGNTCSASVRRSRVAGEPRRLDVAGVAAHVHFGARDADVERQVDDRRGEHDVGHGVAQRGDDAHGEHEERKRHDRVRDAPDDAVRPAAVEAGDGPQRGAHEEGGEHGRDRDAEIEPRGHHDAGEDVAPERVGAEPVRARRRLQRDGGVRGERIVRGQPRARQRRAPRRRRTAGTLRASPGSRSPRSARGAGLAQAGRGLEGGAVHGGVVTLILPRSPAGRSRHRACLWRD